MKNRIPDETLPELCYGLLESQMSDAARDSVTPVVIKRGERGYYPTDWSWRKDNAHETLHHMNGRLGVTPQIADLMMSRSMFVWTS